MHSKPLALFSFLLAAALAWPDKCYNINDEPVGLERLTYYLKASGAPEVFDHAICLQACLEEEGCQFYRFRRAKGCWLYGAPGESTLLQCSDPEGDSEVACVDRSSLTLPIRIKNVKKSLDGVPLERQHFDSPQGCIDYCKGDGQCPLFEFYKGRKKNPEGICRIYFVRKFDPLESEDRGELLICPTDGGSVQPGEPCQYSLDCTSSHFCSEGACQPRKTAGQACSRIEDCVRGLYCLSNTCTEAPTIDNVCGIDEDCDEPGEVCGWSGHTTIRQCLVSGSKPAEETCLFDQECSSGSCVDINCA